MSYLGVDYFYNLLVRCKLLTNKDKGSSFSLGEVVDVEIETWLCRDEQVSPWLIKVVSDGAKGGRNGLGPTPAALKKKKNAIACIKIQLVPQT